jgi:acyl carrier protein
MNHQIKEKLWEYLKENCLPHGSFAEYEDDDNLFETGILDSAGVIAFVCFIEEKFKLSIPDEDLLPDNFKSISAIAAYINVRQDGMPVQSEVEA